MAAFSSDERRCLEQQVTLINVCPTPLDILRETYELDRCIEWIKTNSLSKVSLQFPDSLLCDAPDILLIIQESAGIQCFILGDTSYGSCCVDEVTAEHIHSDGIIHFGHACLSPTRRLPVLYIFQSKRLNIEKLSSAVTTCFEDRKSKLLIFYDVSYAHCIDEVHRALSSLYPNLKSAYPCLNNKLLQEGIKTCLGSYYRLNDGDTLEEYNVLFLGDDGRTFTNYLLELSACRIFRYNPEDHQSIIQPSDMNLSRFLMKRLHLVERVKDAKTLGILIGTLGVDGYLNAIDHIKLLAKKTGKKTYIFSVGRPNVPKLANFPEVDIFVLVACPENSLLDWKEFYQPVVSLYEVELACNPTRQWTSKYVTDFRQLLFSGTDHVHLSDTPVEDSLDVSLITGKVRNVDISCAEEFVSDKSIAARADLSVCESTGSQFLSQRSWQGLEQKLGLNPVEQVVQGRSGIASSYQSEPNQKDV